MPPAFATGLPLLTERDEAAGTEGGLDPLGLAAIAAIHPVTPRFF